MLIEMPDRNKSVVRRLTLELWNDGGDAAAAQALLAHDFPDRAGYLRRALALRTSVSDLSTCTEDLIAEGDLVCERYRRTFWQAGARIEETGLAQYRLRHGRVVAIWGQSQPAAVPPAAEDLTPREMRVALLVAEGRTNPEVGAELALSRKTVEAHLSAVYRKLGLRSRIDLARVLAPHLEALTPVAA